MRIPEGLKVGCRVMVTHDRYGRSYTDPDSVWFGNESWQRYGSRGTVMSVYPLITGLCSVLFDEDREPVDTFICRLSITSGVGLEAATCRGALEL
jgi:hypothetical protein